MKIGFVGLGAMGSRMAANLQKSGYSLVVFNRSADKAAPLVSAGAHLADSPAALAADVDVLFTMLAHPAAVREAALGQDGFLGRLRPGTLWIDCSTVNPSFSREMASAAQARKLRFLDAPVAGSRVPAAKGELVFLDGGVRRRPGAGRGARHLPGEAVRFPDGHAAGRAVPRDQARKDPAWRLRARVSARVDAEGPAP